MFCSNGFLSPFNGAITPAFTVVLLPVAHVQLVSIFGLHNSTLIHPLMLPRLLLLLPFALLAATASAQITAIDSSAQCIAYWSKGDKMTYSVISTKLKLKDADTTMAEQGSYMVDITVLDSTAKSYTIQWAYRDYNLGSDNPVVQKLADMYRDMTIKVKTDEMGAITEVINWKELRDETNRFYKALMKDMKELNELPGFKAMMDRTIKTFSTKEAIESLAVADIQQFHSFYGAAYTLNEELKGRMKVPNFLGGEPFDSDITVVMEELNVEDGNYVLRMTEQVDKDQLTKATLAYVQGMAKSMGVDMPKAEDLGSLEHLVELATRMHESGWPLYSVHTKTINGEGVEQIEERIIELITE
jgi:hypothetical protein